MLVKEFSGVQDNKNYLPDFFFYIAKGLKSPQSLEIQGLQGILIFRTLTRAAAKGNKCGNHVISSRNCVTRSSAKRSTFAFLKTNIIQKSLT
jgi:hypothetical protein